MGMQIWSQLDAVRQEIELMSKLDHENCIKLFEVIEDEENEDDDDMFGEQPSDKLYMIVELAKYKEIMSWDSQQNKFKPSPYLLKIG